MNIGLVSLGCPKNTVDSEIMLGLITQNGHSLVNDPYEADIIIINTCAFINDAKEESVMAILEYARLKSEGDLKGLIVTGCLAERYREEIFESIPEVDAVLGTTKYDSIVEAINAISGVNGESDDRDCCGHCAECRGCDSKFASFGERDDCGWLDNERILTQLEGTAYIKISEGCDNHCTYCIIPKLRGKQVSRTIESIHREAEILASKGIREIILVGQDTTAYGRDLYGRNSLTELIRSVSDIDGIEWIRLLYCYPENIDDELIEEFVRNDKLCKYIDIPIQHASDSVLKRMARRTDREQLTRLLDKLRDKVPDIAIRTTFIVGFPGETEEEFECLKEFVQEQHFRHMGVFRYSREEDTPAYDFDDQIDEKIAERRYNELMAVQQQIVDADNRDMLGAEVDVIVENIDEDGIFYYGRTAWQAPDVDNRIYFASRWELNGGDIVRVRILDVFEYDLTGEVIRC